MNTIVIDCGASFLKAAVFNNEKIERIIHKASPVLHKNESVLEFEQLPKLVDLVEDLLREAIGEEREVNLCISNEMHGFVLAYDNGDLFTDYISWQKEYANIPINGKTSYSVLKEENSINDYIRRTGMPLRAGLPSSNLLYLYRLGLLNKAKDKLNFFTLGSYLINHISGLIPYEHPTNAAATGVYDIISGTWNYEYIDYICRDRISFPDVGVDPISFEFEGIHVNAFPAIGDQQAALLGAGFTRNEDISFNLGTGAQVSVLTDVPEFSDDYQIRPYFFNMFLKTIPHIPSGRALNVFFRFIKSVLNSFGEDIDDEIMWGVILESAWNAKKDSGLDIDLSFFENAVTDHLNGAIKNISEYSLTMENVWASVFNKASANFIEVANRIINDKSMYDRLVFSGGIAKKNDYIREKIIKYYSYADYIVAENETLYGLYKYSLLNK